MGSRYGTRSWIHRQMLTLPIPLMTTIASCGALQGWEEVAFSPSLLLFLALSHVTHSCSVPETHHVCYGFSSAYGCSRVTLCTVIPNKWLLLKYLCLLDLPKSRIHPTYFFPAKMCNPANFLVMVARKWPFTKKRRKKRKMGIVSCFSSMIIFYDLVDSCTLYLRMIVQK